MQSYRKWLKISQGRKGKRRVGTKISFSVHFNSNRGRPDPQGSLILAPEEPRGDLHQPRAPRVLREADEGVLRSVRQRDQPQAGQVQAHWAVMWLCICRV